MNKSLNYSTKQKEKKNRATLAKKYCNDTHKLTETLKTVHDEITNQSTKNRITRLINTIKEQEEEEEDSSDDYDSTNIDEIYTTTTIPINNK